MKETTTTSTMVNKEYLEIDINNKIQAGEIRVSDIRLEIRDRQMSIEYELGVLSALKSMREMLED